MFDSFIYSALLFLSLVGWGMLVHYKFKIELAFIPIFIFSTITCVMFGAGILNIMPLMAMLIFIIGLILCIVYAYLIFLKKYSIKTMMIPSTWIYIVYTVVIVILLKDVIYIHYDNFSHWGLIVKEMDRINGLPDGTTMITFQNYPPGSAVFIYFITKIVGYSESYALMAQAILLIANLIVIFVFCQWKNKVHFCLSIIASLALLSVINSNIYNLLVDTLVGMTALAITVIAYYYRSNWQKNIIVNAPLLTLLILIKDSGKLFFAINVVLIIGFIYVNYFKGRKIKLIQAKILVYGLVFILIMPLFTNYLWIRYTDKAYPNHTYESNKFAITSDKVTDVNKSEEFVSSLAPNLIEASTDLHSINFKMILLLNVLSILIMIWIYSREKYIPKLLLFSTLFVNFIYIVYIFSLYLMYLFLMPESEAVRLAGFSRYQSTMAIYFAGVLMTVILLTWLKYSSLLSIKVMRIGLSFCIGFIFIYPLWDNVSSILVKPDVKSSIRWQFISQLNKIEKKGDENPSIIYYSPNSKDDKGYLQFVTAYDQLSNNRTIVHSLNDEEGFQDLMESYDYLVVLDSDKSFEKFLLKFIDVKDSKGVYKLTLVDHRLDVRTLNESQSAN